MKKLMVLFSAAAALCLSACVNIETVKSADLNGQALASKGGTIAHVNIQNSGLYLFSIPLLTGSTQVPGQIAVFDDTVTALRVAPVMAKEAKKLGGTEVQTVASQYSEFGFIIVSRSINMSGNVIR